MSENVRDCSLLLGKANIIPQFLRKINFQEKYQCCLFVSGGSLFYRPNIQIYVCLHENCKLKSQFVGLAPVMIGT